MKSCFQWILVSMIAGWAAVGVTAAEKPKITSQDQLPRHEYALPGKASAVLTDDAVYRELAAAVRADLEALIEDYDIQDRSTLQDILSTLMLMDMQAGDDEAALRRLARVRELEQKPAARLTTGVLMESVIEARQKTGSSESAAFRKAFQEIYAAKINALPYEIVGDNLKQAKGSTEIVTEALLVGMVDSQVQPGLDKTGTVSGDVARGLLDQHAYVKSFVPLRDERVAVLKTYLDAHHVEKPDIWAARNVTLTENDHLTPVVIAISDSGIDASVYEGKMWVNPAEQFDGTDTDGSGYVDDVHGIAYDLKSNRVPGILYPLTPEQQAAYPQMRDMTKGLLDLRANIDSPEAAALRKHVVGLEPGDVQTFLENLRLVGNYTHGTHVAGIAAEGNPAARLMAARITFDYRTIPDVPTIEQAHKDAQAIRDGIAYIREHGARIVNMSWGGSPQGIEADFEANGAGGTPEERRRKAREIYEISLNALTEAIAEASDVLFVVSAGNSDNDAEFSEMYPSGIDLPNILTVGAVDQAGEETSFSTFGANVDVHANGFEVPSYIPGGEIVRYSGTSMAAPNVTNLAAKLLAVKPDLTVAQLVGLIVDAADESPDGRIRLINPRRSFELLRKRG